MVIYLSDNNISVTNSNSNTDNISGNQDEKISITKLEIAPEPIDMKELYYCVIMQCIYLGIKCPFIFASIENLEENFGSSIIYARLKNIDADVLLISNLMKNEDILNEIPRLLAKPAARTLSLDIPVGFIDNPFHLYLSAASFSVTLKISCPQIFLAREIPGENGEKLTGVANAIESPTGSQIISLVFVPENPHCMLFTLAYYLRHLWQEKYHRKLYYSNYDSSLEEPAYSSQKAEIDANAYAVRAYEYTYGDRPSYITGYTEIDKAIFERANKMAVCFDGGHSAKEVIARFGEEAINRAYEMALDFGY